MIYVYCICKEFIFTVPVYNYVKYQSRPIYQNLCKVVFFPFELVPEPQRLLYHNIGERGMPLILRLSPCDI